MLGKRDWHMQSILGSSKMLILWKRRLRRGCRESWKGSEFQPQQGCAEAGGFHDVLVGGKGLRVLVQGTWFKAQLSPSSLSLVFNKGLISVSKLECFQPPSLRGCQSLLCSGHHGPGA